MKVYLIKTPEVEFEFVEQIADYLNGFVGPMEFVAREYNKFNTEDFPFLKKTPVAFDFELDSITGDNTFFYKRRTIPQTGRKRYLKGEHRLTFQDLFALCKFYKNKMKREKDSYVILLTKWGNEFNFFSSFDSERNIFVNITEWDKYIDVVNSVKYPIAFQIVENILSSVMKIDFDPEIFIDNYVVNYIQTAPNRTLPTLKNTNKYIHEEPQGCINDFCRNKKQIVLKLKNVNAICFPCLNKLIGIGT